MFEHVKEGDVVNRILAGLVPMQLKVTEVRDGLIFCGPEGVGWKFRADNGNEVDEDLDWDGILRTGSYLKL